VHTQRVNVSETASSARKLRGIEREIACLRLRKAGLSYRAIAAELNISPSGAYKAVTRALRKLNEKSAEATAEVRALEVQRLDDLLENLWPYRHKPAYVDRILRVMERRARLLGLDAPERREITGGMEIEIGWGDETAPTGIARGTGGDT